MKCQQTVKGRYGEVNCGEWQGGVEWYCDSCTKQLFAEYPQGWRHYPGDVCKHGTYVGGCGIDWMCGYCEAE